MYGNFNLKREDHDFDQSEYRYGGNNNPQIPPTTAETPPQGGATVVMPEYVQQLQRDLRELGFAIVGTPDGSFGRNTEWAVREFQIYASMSHVAQLNQERLRQLTNNPHPGETANEVAAFGMAPDTPQTTPENRRSYYVATLDQVQNTARHDGPISGVVNERTRNAIRHWLNNNYRCPVVIEAWNMQNNQRISLFQNGANIWKHDAVNSTPRIFSVDFSCKYTFPTGRIANTYQVLGTYTPYNQFGGGGSDPKKGHCWSEAEMMPGLLIGPGNTVATLQANPASATTKTYKVVRAVAEQECVGYFDSLNSYDDALLTSQ